MTTLRTLCSRIVDEDEGQDLIEYSLLAALISVVAVLAISAVGSKLQLSYQNIETSIP